MNPKYFNPWSEVERTQNRLPHWQQAGASYFVTWRLADSLPDDLLNEHYCEREQWISRHPRPWSEEVEADYHRRFSLRLDVWLDQGHGSCLLRNPELASHVSKVLLHFEGDRVFMISFVVMPNHVHCLFTLNPEWKLEQMLHSWKRYSAREINRSAGNAGALWQKDYFDRLIRDPSHFRNCVRYIRNNPVKARLETSEYIIFESPLAQAIQ